MKTKNIEQVIAPSHIHFVGDGFRVHNFIPGSEGLSMERMSPFVLLDYNPKFYFPPSEKARGVGPHPHRGFETVTIAYKGRVAHHDSTGSSGVINEGDVQWMTAGSGILHKEYHEESFSKKGGDFQVVQLWVNLPSDHKMTAPKYQALANADMGINELENGKVEIIAGNYNGINGPANTYSPVNLFNLFLKKGGEAPMSFPEEFNTALVIIEGSISVNSIHIEENHFVLFENSGEDFIIQANADCIVLVMSALPIDEPIAAQGPFVMNTRMELIQAYEDFNSGKFEALSD